MITENSKAAFFNLISSESKTTIIELQNINKIPVGALYLQFVNPKSIVLTETNNTEKYFLYLDGVGIYFSFFRKIIK